MWMMTRLCTMRRAEARSGAPFRKKTALGFRLMISSKMQVVLFFYSFLIKMYTL